MDSFDVGFAMGALAGAVVVLVALRVWWEVRK